MMRFHWSVDKPFGPSELGQVIPVFCTTEVPRLNKYFNYYAGKMPIMFKTYTDTSKTCNHICVNFCQEIVKQFEGYIGTVTYDNDDFEEIQRVINFNDDENENSEWLHDALLFGRAIEINYIDEEGQQRYHLLDPRQSLPIYDDTLDEKLLYLIRFWRESGITGLEANDNYYVQVYGPTATQLYKSNMGWSSFELIEEQPNYYGQCPISLFTLNKDETSIFDQIMTLNDAYNELMSTTLDEWDSFADAYMILKGMTADADDIATMKENRVLILDVDADASYLTKQINDSQVQNMLNTYKQQIYNKSGCVDFTDEKFMAQSGVALRYKLQGMEDIAAAICRNFKKALQHRIELITSILNITAEESMWRDVEITIGRNLPDTLLPQTSTELMQYKGLVSDRTLLTLLPFVKNADEELEEVKAQNEANMSLYSVNSFNSEDEDEQVLAEQGD